MFDSSDKISSEPQDIDQLRKQARQRFIGAAVLVALAVGLLPFLLDSQPRPIPAQVAIEIAKIEEAKKQEPIKPEAVKPPEAPAVAAPIAFASAPEPTPVPTPATPTAAELKNAFIIQAGVFTDAANAKAAMEKLDKAGLKYFVSESDMNDGSHRTRIRLGPYATRQEAFEMQALVAKTGLKSVIYKP
jgi:DedD protein